MIRFSENVASISCHPKALPALLILKFVLKRVVSVKQSLRRRSHRYESAPMSGLTWPNAPTTALTCLFALMSEHVHLLIKESAGLEAESRRSRSESAADDSGHITCYHKLFLPTSIVN
jgi:hypothetical protein